jgi:DNA-binding MarR family transcriptional regulator
VVRALSMLGPASIAAIARQVGMRHSATSQTVAQMQRQRLVKLIPGPDGRERIVSPTPALMAILPQLEQHWAATNAAAAALEAELPHPLAATLHAAVEALDRRSFAERARAIASRGRPVRPKKSLIVAALLILGAFSIADSYAQETPPPSKTEPAAEVRAIAERIAGLLEADYLYPETGKAYAARVRKQAASGAYDKLNGRALADALTLDLLAVQDDSHLRVRFGARMMTPPMVGPEGSGGTSNTGPMPGPSTPPGPRPTSAAMEQAGWIAPGIAFVRFNEFPPDPVVTENARIFLRDHASATTLIFDLRTNRGGGPAQMDVIFPLLFDKPTRLCGMATRAGVERIGPIAGPNMRKVEGEPGFVTTEYWVTPGATSPLQKARVIVLTSPATGSAGEQFAAALKWTGRATLIGASTAGANHFGSMEPVGGGLTLFVPVGRTFNPADGKDWEGTGISPDIVVVPEQALAVALVRAGLPEAKAASLAEQHQPHSPMTKPPAIAPRKP